MLCCFTILVWRIFAVDYTCLVCIYLVGSLLYALRVRFTVLCYARDFGLFNCLLLSCRLVILIVTIIDLILMLSVYLVVDLECLWLVRFLVFLLVFWFVICVCALRLIWF